MKIATSTVIFGKIIEATLKISRSKLYLNHAIYNFGKIDFGKNLRPDLYDITGKTAYGIISALNNSFCAFD